ncbi:MAG: peptide-methionine (R)-S-oxide reductase MsrB [Pseudomonadota bacterium]
MFSRRRFLISAPIFMVAGACARQTPATAEYISADARFDNSEWRALTPDEWRARLESDLAYQVLREEATERPFTSPLNDEKRDGTFVCAGCELPLFESQTKYESGTGWPSFFDVIAGAVGTKEDNTLWMKRTEYHCARCLGHQGHVFADGPAPTGLRYCNNGVALKFVSAAA